MPKPSLEDALRDLPRTGTLVKDRGYRQVWRFEHNGKAYFLKFYPKGGVRDRWRRRLRGSPAMREFLRLQWLQKAAVPAPRAAAVLMGLRLQNRVGDAVILDAIEPSAQLDTYLNDLALRGEPIPNRRELSKQVRELIHTLGKAQLGHDDLHLGNFLLHDDKLFLLDAYAVRRGGLRTADTLQLAHSVSRFATRTDLLRGWAALGGAGAEPPRHNPVAERHYRAFIQKTEGPNRYFGRLGDGKWEGPFFKQAKYPRRWSTVSQMELTDDDWRAAWATLRQQIEADSLQVLKRSPSGDVLAAELALRGNRVPVIVKHPRRKYWYRWFNEIARGSRARRAWVRSWEMIARNVPVAWPMLLVERRTFGYVTDALIVFERIPGKTLFHADLGAMMPGARDTIFRRSGRTLRKIDEHGFAHLDAKSTNFIVLEDERVGPTPVLVDMDGIRRRRWSVAEGIERLLRAMKRHPQYTASDSLALCQGYAPFARMQQEQPEETSPRSMTPVALTSPPRRVLIIKPSAIGDVVHALPVLNLIRRRWPEAYIAWLVTPACSDLLEGHPQLDEVIRFERRRFAQGWRKPSAAMGLFRFARELRERQFDLVIDLQGLFRSGWLSWQTRAPYRVGFANAREMAPIFYTHRVPIEDVEQHAVDRYLTLAETLGCGREPVEFHFATSDVDRRMVTQLLNGDEPYAVLLPGTNWATKRWPVEHFAATVQPLRDHFGLRTIVAGGLDDRSLAASIPRALDLTGATNLRQLVALLERAAVVIANDSGPMHIASALGRPLVTPYGPTSPIRTGPYRRDDAVIRLDIPCSPCFSRRCSHQSCLQWLKPEHVLREVERQLSVNAAT